MIRDVDFSKVRSVVELGPGTGAATQAILRRCKPDTTVVLIELEKTYIPELKRRFGRRVIIENTGAHNLDAVLKKHGVVRVDLIVSGLPFVQSAEGIRFIEAVKRHTDKGAIFRYFTYLPPAMKRVYKNLPIRKIAFVLQNFPPMWIYGVN